MMNNDGNQQGPPAGGAAAAAANNAPDGNIPPQQQQQQPQQPQAPQPAPFAYDPNADANVNMAAAIGALANAQQAEANRRQQQQEEDEQFGKANKKPPKLDSVAPEKFYSFATHFRNAVATNRWSNRRARLELKDAMQGTAEAVILGIPVQDEVVPCPDWQQLLTAYRDALIPPATVEAMKTKARLLRQREGEALMAWFSRLKQAYTYAYDAMFAQFNMTADTYEPVRDQFLDGLANSVIQEKVRDQRPNTLAEALVLAQGFEAALTAQRASEGGNGGRRRAVNNIDAHQKETRSCWQCGRLGHLARDCRSTSNNRWQQSGRVPGGRGRGRGNRCGAGRGGRARGRGGSRGNGRGGSAHPRGDAQGRSNSETHAMEEATMEEVSNAQEGDWTNREDEANTVEEMSGN